MGLIIGPVVIFWIVSFFYTWRMGYVLFTGKAFFPYILPVIVIAFLGASIYVLGGLFTFIGRRELWGFDIPLFFLLNKYAFIVFVLSMLSYFFGGSVFSGDISKAVIFILAFSISLGSLVGCFSSSAFIQKYNISVTY
ncbi:hypothetical protein LCL85_07900 [Vibrio alginolyticus]|nr:hypothetical protein [Vibrio alginolyticus]